MCGDFISRKILLLHKNLVCIYYLTIYDLLFGSLLLNSPFVVQKKKETLKPQNLLWDWLSHEDSNLDRQYQKL